MQTSIFSNSHYREAMVVSNAREDLAKFLYKDPLPDMVLIGVSASSLLDIPCIPPFINGFLYDDRNPSDKSRHIKYSLTTGEFVDAIDSNGNTIRKINLAARYE